MLQLYQHTFQKNNGSSRLVPTVANIGNQMLGVGDNGYALPFEVVSMLLLAAMIGCIVIALNVQNHATNMIEPGLYHILIHQHCTVFHRCIWFLYKKKSDYHADEH